MCNVTAAAIVVVVRAAVVGGLVVGGMVVGDGTVVATSAVVGTGPTVVVVPDECSVVLDGCCLTLDEATTRGVP